MARLTDLEKVRRKRARRRTIQSLLGLAAFAAVVFLMVATVRRAGEVDIKTAYSDMKAEIVTGQGYPVSLPGGKVSAFSSFDHSLAILTDTNFYAYNKSGKQTLNAQHSLANESMATSANRTMLYDRGGTKFSVYSKSALLHSLTSKYAIHTADISDNGNFAIATGSAQYLAQVTVYNKYADEIFKWYSADKPVISISLSDSKDAMLVGSVDVSQGSYHSGISRFQFSIDKELGRVELPGELLLSVEYWGTNDIRAFTDRRVVHYNGELKEMASYDYSELHLDRYVNAADGSAVLAMGNYSKGKRLTVVALDNMLKERGSFIVDYDITALRADKEFIYIGSKNQVEIFRHDGTLVASLPIYNLDRIQTADGYLYCISNSEIIALEISKITMASEAGSSSSAREMAASSSQPNENSGATKPASLPEESENSTGEAESSATALEEMQSATSSAL